MATAADDSSGLQEVVITGSHIRRTESEGSLPVQVISTEQLTQTGAVNVEQLMQTVSAALQGNNNVVAASAAGASTGGVSGISLRGLGSNRTLVLLNGQRLAAGGVPTDSSTVDVNTIPMAALERVEVLKDGASAIYGSDAIAGVVNFILKKDYEGAEVSATGGGTSGGGATSRALSAVAGFGNLRQDGYNLLLIGSYNNDSPLYGAQRKFANSSIIVSPNSGANLGTIIDNDSSSGNTYPGNVFGLYGDPNNPGVIYGNPSYPNCSPSVIDPNYAAAGIPVCRFDPAGLVSLLPAVERWSLMSSLHMRVGDNAEMYAEASLTHKQTTTQIQPTPLSDQFSLPGNNVLYNLAPYNGYETIVLQSTSAYYPTAWVQNITGGETPNLLVRYRCEVCGPRITQDVSESPRVVLGFKGTNGGWDWDVSALQSETKLSESTPNGFVVLSKILPLLNSGTVNFFGDNTAQTLAAVDATKYTGETLGDTNGLYGVSGSISRSLWSLPGGPIGVALGVDYRHEWFSLSPAPELTTGDLSGYGGNFLPIDKSRDVRAVYGEARLPLLHSLEADLALRNDYYSGTGSKTVPKVSLSWKPMSEILLRAGYGKGFRAPSLTDLYQPQLSSVSLSGVSDPLRCGKVDNNGNTDNLSTDCATQFPVTIGGNPQLKPEESENYTFGVVVEPLRNLSLGLDWFQINVKNLIGSLDAGTILGNLAQYGNLVTRGPADPGTPGLPGPITNILTTNLNFGEVKVQGVDADLRYRLQTERFGTFNFGLVGSYFQKYDVENTDGTFSSVVGEVTSPGGVIPRWHHYLSLDWKYGDWDVFLADNYQSHYRDIYGTFDCPTAADGCGYVTPQHVVGAYQTVDARVAYTGVQNLLLAVGVKNLLDKDPPYTNAGGQNYFQSGYDPGYADPRGRYVYGTVTYKFGPLTK